MSAPNPIWIMPVVEEWQADDGLHEDQVLEVLQDIVYLKDQVDGITEVAYWAIYEKQLQSGFSLGGPLA